MKIGSCGSRGTLVAAWRDGGMCNESNISMPCFLKLQLSKSTVSIHTLLTNITINTIHSMYAVLVEVAVITHGHGGLNISRL